MSEPAIFFDFKKMTLVMTLTGTQSNETLHLSPFDQQILYEYDKDEVDVNIKLTFIPPYYAIDNNKFYVQRIDNDEWQEIQINAQFKIDDEQQLINKFNEICAQVNYQIQIDNLYYENNNKLRFTSTIFKAIKIDDYYFSKILGFKQNTIYEMNEAGYITADQILYPYIYKYLIINCYDIQDFTVIEKGQKRFLLMKQFRNWQAGVNTQVTSDLSVSFPIINLMRGIQVQFLDENYIPLPLSGQEYTIDLYIGKSRKQLMKKQYQEEQQQIKQQEELQKRQILEQRKQEKEQAEMMQEQQAQQIMKQYYEDEEKELQAMEQSYTLHSQKPTQINQILNENQKQKLIRKKKINELNKKLQNRQIKAEDYNRQTQEIKQEIQEIKTERYGILSQALQNIDNSVEIVDDGTEHKNMKIKQEEEILRQPELKSSWGLDQTVQQMYNNEHNHEDQDNTTPLDQDQLIQYAWNKTKFYPEQTIQPPPNQKRDFDKYLEEEQEKFDQSIIKGTERPKSIYYNPENQNFQETILRELLETQAQPGSQTQAPNIEETKVLSQLEQTGQKFQQIDQYNQLLQQINQVNSKQQLREIAKQMLQYKDFIRQIDQQNNNYLKQLYADKLQQYGKK
ncbi:Hypothetical_protein [Hexamita inflata]|uniref:Hypothetical_protein n=1 Tax=Hexamita inflata TaxID=28002 RepID=A0AA86QEH3_9EUKA|nr:Hypothetical protein HINF_LOCUS45396 [Hexamita inflata]